MHAGLLWHLLAREDEAVSRAYHIRSTRALGDREIRGLCELLVDCVEGGASVGFMTPMTRGKAMAFWEGVAAAAERGERLIVLAEDGAGMIVGTAQVILAVPENQPHRGDLAKMLVHRSARRQGVAAALLVATEQAARESGKTLLVLDTVTGSDAERLYSRHGWQRCGVITNYALFPDGAYCDTTVFYKHLADEKRPIPGACC